MGKENFGRDLGVLHEMIVTGRGIGVNPKIYSCLAHDKEFFVMIADLVTYKKAIGKKIIAGEIAEADIFHLCCDIRSITNNGNMSRIGYNHESWNLFIPFLAQEKRVPDILGIMSNALSSVKKGVTPMVALKKGRISLGMCDLAFFLMLTSRIESMGITPNEFMAFSKDDFLLWNQVNPYIYSYIGKDCNLADYIGEILRKIALNRKIINIMYNT